MFFLHYFPSFWKTETVWETFVVVHLNLMQRHSQFVLVWFWNCHIQKKCQTETESWLPPPLVCPLHGYWSWNEYSVQKIMKSYIKFDVQILMYKFDCYKQRIWYENVFTSKAFSKMFKMLEESSCNCPSSAIGKYSCSFYIHGIQRKASHFTSQKGLYHIFNIIFIHIVVTDNY